VNPFPKWEIKGVLEQTNRCPRKDLDAESLAYLPLYSMYRSGHLWRSGGVRRQPARYLEAMRLIESIIGKLD
jgi:hypothetical protein